MELLSINSYIKNGHEYHLYAYDDIVNLPKGAILRNGNEILPKSEIFSYSGSKSNGGGSVSAFSNYFRYKLLLERGGYWSDTDMICRKRLDFNNEYVFSSEQHDNALHATSGLMKTPPDSEFAQFAWGVCQTMDKSQLTWGNVGPMLVRELVDYLGMNDSVKSPNVFCPIRYQDWHMVLNPKANISIGEESYTIHLWNEMWRRNGVDKDCNYHPDSLYEQLKKEYL